MYIGSSRLMKQYDEMLLASGYTIEELVDKASDCLIKHIPRGKVAILCGPGHNGADGLSLALKLLQRGDSPYIFILQKYHCSKVYDSYLEKCKIGGIVIKEVEESFLDGIVDFIAGCDIIVDALFGFGLNGCPRGLYALLIEAVNRLCHPCVIAIDIPTGLNCNTGKPYSSVLVATKTITLTALKDGFLNPDSAFFTGDIVVEMLDINEPIKYNGLCQWADKKMIMSLMKERRYDGHKGTYGKVGMIVGCGQYKGAALLSCKSAVYSGSGIVTLISESGVNDSLTLFCPEATTRIREEIVFENDLNIYDALLIGSGLGLDEKAFGYVKETLACGHQPIVIDGDALRILSNQLTLLKQDRTFVLTPHLQEFYRLHPFEENSDLLYEAIEFAKTYNIILVLKGPHTIVTDGDVCYRVSSGNKAMAVAGMGDTLAGMITSFLGQGYPALKACLLAVYIHGYAGDCIARNHYTVMPSHLIEKIPEVMDELLKEKSNLG